MEERLTLLSDRIRHNLFLGYRTDFLWFPRNRVKTFIFLFPFLMTTVMLPARLVLGVYLILDNLLPFIVNGGAGTGVAHGAHIGGFLGGLGLAYGFDRWRGVARLRL